MCLEIILREPAEDVGNFDHGVGMKSEAEVNHEFVEEICERGASRLGEMQVEGGRGKLAVTEQELDNSDINPVFEEPSRIGVSKTMERHRTNTGRLGDGRKSAVEGASSDRVVSGPIGKYPASVSVKLPKPPQTPEHRVRKWDDTLLIALADDCEEVFAAVNCRDLKTHRLTGSQAARIHEREAGLVNRICCEGEQLTGLGVGKRMG
jgi:hypothetical protein